ncbi:hypothetical protein JY816_04895 [Clostridioides difficile]|nr:hypothetical protein [Clostridioides difficile]MCJ0280482.1 hypothetical protein [Clostridioides difficile]MCJ0531351.1 hypothetical protein [Clostridioides difficile]MDI0304561.1 hypothetical protein [Clostridioides difficile]HBE8445275.1 hypothetical protein [Clostridioides difficile]HBF6653201.1 hypothetical protein [Clostridioides difficile]
MKTIKFSNKISIVEVMKESNDNMKTNLNEKVGVNGSGQRNCINSPDFIK